MTKKQPISKESLEQEYKKLVQYVKDHYFIVAKRDKTWDVGCWLGKKPTGRLFKYHMVEANKLDENLEQLAKDMFEYLYTKKNAEIITKETNHHEQPRN